MAILRIRKPTGEVVEIACLKGDTPKKGVDYYTDADLAELKELVSQAAKSADDAGYYAAAAEDNKNQTNNAVTEAADARDAAIYARDEAVTAKGDAQTAEANAKDSETSASTHAAVAADSADSAGISEANAAASAADAQESAEAATTAVATAAAEIKSVVANAIPKQVEGQLLRISDVSPLEHSCTVSVVAENIIPYPYAETTKMENGITFTDNGDGTVTANGVSESGAMVSFYLVRSLYLPAGTYRLSSGGATQHGLVIFTGNALNEEGVSLHQSPAAEPVEFTVVTPGEVSVRVELFEADNLTFKPEITVVPTTVQVLRSGKNLLPTTYSGTTNTSLGKGITFTDHGDGSVSVEGTATAVAQFKLNTGNLMLPPGTYVASGGINGTYVTAEGKNKYFAPTQPVFTLEDGGYIRLIYISVTEGATVNATYYPMLEAGSVATEYEQQTEPTEYASDTDGTVEVALAADKDVTLYTNREGVTLRCNYNRDLNKVIGELVNAIISLGGNV